MSSSILSYLLLFLPLIAAVFCFLINFKKSDFLIFIVTTAASLIITTKLAFDFLISGEIKSSSSLEILSIPTEYSLDYLALFFLLIFLSSQILMAFIYRLNLSKALNSDNCQLFYASWLLNIFGAIGIFTTNNIFNLFIFIEIYCLTFCAIMAASNNLALSKLAFKYFCRSAFGAILMLLAIIFIYVSGDFLQIDMIDNSLFSAESGLMAWLILVAIILKFFPINLYFYVIKSRDQLSDILLNFAFITNALAGFYLLLRVLLLLFDDNQIFFQSAILAGFILIFYSNYKMFGAKYLKVWTLYFLLANLGFVLITFLVNQSPLGGLLYVANYAASGLILFFIAKYLAKNHKTLQLKLLKHNFNWQNKAIIFAITLTISNLPLTLIFWANWHLALVSFDFDIYGLLIILPILSTNFALANFQIKYLGTCLAKATS